MRVLVLIIALVCVFGGYALIRTKAGATNSVQPPIAEKPAKETPTKSESPSAKGSTKVDFQTQIRPILEARCQPCHFNGGKVYKEMPFDRPETIHSLGTKLFTRIKDENERRLITTFLEQK